MFEISKIIFSIGFLGTIISLILLIICELRYNKKFKKTSVILLTSFIIMLSGGIAGGMYFKETSNNQPNNVKQEVIQTELNSNNTANNKAVDNKLADNKAVDNKQADNKPKDTQATNTNINQADGVNNYPYEIGMTFLKIFYNLNAGNVDKQYNEVLKYIGTNQFYGSHLGLYNTFRDRKQSLELIKINKTMFLTSGETMTLEDDTYKVYNMYFNLDYKENGKKVINENGVLTIFQDRFGKYRIVDSCYFKEGPLDENKLITLRKCILNFQEKAFNLSDKYLSIRYCGGFNNLSGKLNELKSITTQECYDQTIKNAKEDHQTNTYAGRKLIHIWNCEFKWNEGDDTPSFEVNVESELNGVLTGSISATHSSVYILFKDNSYVVTSGR